MQYFSSVKGEGKWTRGLKCIYGPCRTTIAPKFSHASILTSCFPQFPLGLPWLSQPPPCLHCTLYSNPRLALMWTDSSFCQHSPDQMRVIFPPQGTALRIHGKKKTVGGQGMLIFIELIEERLLILRLWKSVCKLVNPGIAHWTIIPVSFPN